MNIHQSGCLLCGAPLRYQTEPSEMQCALCGKTVSSNTSCEQGHYICDECHIKKGLQIIREHCLASNSRNPFAIMQELMDSPWIYMHGPEHHVLVGAALLTAYHNCGADIDFPALLEQMFLRGQDIPGGICGFCGSCGAGISSGIFISLITGATPLSEEAWGLANQMTAKALQSIGKVGGPRCCKRDSFLSAAAAISFTKQHFGIEMEQTYPLICRYSGNNQQCIAQRCPFYPKSKP